MSDEAPKRCQRCGQELLPWQRKFCSRLHYGRARTRPPGPGGALAQFLWEQICNENVTKAEFARRSGVPAATVTRLLNGTVPRDRTYERLKQRFGDDLPEIVTDTQRARSQVRPPEADAGPLAHFLWERLSAENVSKTEFAESIGFSRTTLGDLLNGTVPRDRTYERLKQRFGDDLPEIVTDTQRAPARAYASLALMWTPEARRRSAETQRGRKKPAQSEAMKAKVREWREAGRAWTTRPGPRPVQERVASSLKLRLRLCPAPNRQTVNSWARELSKKLGVPPAAIIEMWRPALEERGLRKTGRPRKKDRHDLIAALVPTERLESGRMRHGAWRRITDAVNREERRGPDNLLGEHDVKKFWYRAEEVCTECPTAKSATAKPTTQQAVNSPGVNGGGLHAPL